MSYDSLVTGNTVRFSTYAQTILGAKFEKVKVESTMTYAAAIRRYEVTTKHNAVHSQLPPGTPTDPKLLTYYELLDVNANRMICLAKEWIKSETIQVIANTGCLIEIPNIGQADFERISLALRSIGIAEFTITPTN